MKRIPLLTLLALLLLAGSVTADSGKRRLVRLESNPYGWYAVMSAEFDRTVGTRKLYKISGADQFLTGLAGRLVLLEGVFSGGKLTLPALAAPPQSLPENAYRQVIIIDVSAATPVVTSLSGHHFTDPNSLLSHLSSGRWRIDGVWIPEEKSDQLRLLALLQSDQLTWEAPPAPGDSVLDQPALVDLTLTQDLLNALATLGLRQAPVRASYQGVELALSQLQLRLDEGSSSIKEPWRLVGSVQLSYNGSTNLAETSFSVGAIPVVEDDILKLKPDWTGLSLEGQLPFAFSLGSSLLSGVKQYLPEKIPVLPLSAITSRLKKERLLPEGFSPHWYLGTPHPGSVRLALDQREAPLPSASPVPPGSFRLILGAPTVERLVQRQVASMLSPDKPYRPSPPIEVGRALFVPILVKEIYIRKLDAGYSQGAFRFQNLTVDVGWEAGPFSGLEPLLVATGHLKPGLTGTGGARYWTWDLAVTSLEVQSDKIPGDKAKLASEFGPKMESELGAKLAEKQKFSNRLPLSQVWSQLNGELVVSEMKTLPDSLLLEGSLEGL